QDDRGAGAQPLRLPRHPARRRAPGQFPAAVAGQPADPPAPRRPEGRRPDPRPARQGQDRVRNGPAGATYRHWRIRTHDPAPARRSRRLRSIPGQRPGAIHRHLRRRLLLVHGGSLREGARRGLGGLGLHRRPHQEPELRDGFLGHHRTRGSHRGEIRSVEDQLRKAARRVLDQPRSDVHGPPVLRPWLPVPARDLLAGRGAEAPRRCLEAQVRKAEDLQAADRHADRQGLAVLARRGIPPGLLQEESGALQLLLERLRPLQPVERTLGEPAQMTTAVTPNAAKHDQLPPLASRFVDVAALPWTKTAYPGIEAKTLLLDRSSGLLTVLMKMAPNARLPDHEHVLIEQTYVLEGTLHCG